MSVGRKLVLLPLLLLLPSCSKDDSSDVPQTVPSAVYSVGTPTCASTSEAPDYPSPNTKANLYDFQNIATHNMEVRGSDIVQTIQSETCKIELVRTIAINADGYLSFREKKTVSTDPDSCTLDVIHDETTFTFTKGFASLSDSESETIEILYEVQRLSDTEFLLITRDEAPDNQVWQAFGCASVDRIQRRLTRL